MVWKNVSQIFHVVFALLSFNKHFSRFKGYKQCAHGMSERKQQHMQKCNVTQ